MNTVILVHPCMSPRVTFDIIKKKGYKILSIITKFELNKIDRTFVKRNSDFLFEGGTEIETDFNNINAIILSNHLKICGVINGVDASVYYSDYLAKFYIDEEIELEFSKIRTNKNAVNLCLEEQKLDNIPGLELRSDINIDQLKEQIKVLNFPLVGKPSENTAAMSGFEVLYNMSDVERYIREYYNQKNPYYQDKLIEKIVFQKYIDRLDYKEYVLDFVSYKGRHYCQGIIHYDKEIIDEHYPISRFYRPLSLSTNPELTILVNYVENCLNALKVRNGLTHNEVFYDGKSMVLLVETNNRVAGGGLLELIDLAYGSNPIGIYLDLLLGNPVSEIKKNYHAIAMDVYNHFLSCPEEINLSGLNSATEILHFRNKRKTTKNYFEKFSRVDSVNACLLLSNESRYALERDCDTILYREKMGQLFISSIKEYVYCDNLLVGAK